MTLNLISKHLMLIFCVVRPGYLTYNDFNRKVPEQCVGWFKYWIVYGFVTIILSITDLLFFWFSSYEVGKLIVIFCLTVGAPRNGIRIYDYIFSYLLESHKDIFNKYPLLNSKLMGVFNATAETETTNEVCLDEEGEESSDKDKDEDKDKDKFYFNKTYNGGEIIFTMRGTKKYIRSKIRSHWQLKKLPATKPLKPIISEDELEVDC